MKDLKDVTKDDIKVVFLTTGEEIVGVVEETQDGKGIEILKPAKMQPVSAEKVMVVSMVMLGEFDSCGIKHDHIITIVPCREEVADLWLEKITGKKPVIKPKGGIVVP